MIIWGSVIIWCIYQVFLSVNGKHNIGNIMYDEYMRIDNGDNA